MHLLEVYFFITQGGGNVLCAGTQASLLGASDLPPVPPTSHYHSINFEKRHWQKDLQVLGSCVQPLSLGFENRETCFSFFSIPPPRICNQKLLFFSLHFRVHIWRTQCLVCKMDSLSSRCLRASTEEFTVKLRTPCYTDTAGCCWSNNSRNCAPI